MIASMSPRRASCAGARHAAAAVAWAVTPTTAQPPPNYLVWAILSTLFCCLPLGIASIVFLAWFAGRGHADRDAEDAARDFFDAHGRWPDET